MNNKNCIDMELSYFVECASIVDKTARKSNKLPCLNDSEVDKNLTDKNVLILSTKHELNSPMTLSFNGE